MKNKCKNCELKEYVVVTITDDGKCRECGKQLLPNFNLNTTKEVKQNNDWRERKSKKKLMEIVTEYGYKCKLGSSEKGTPTSEDYENTIISIWTVFEEQLSNLLKEQTTKTIDFMSLDAKIAVKEVLERVNKEVIGEDRENVNTKSNEMNSFINKGIQIENKLKQEQRQKLDLIKGEGKL